MDKEIQQIKQHKKKTITIEEISSIYNITEQVSLKTCIEMLIMENIIIPIKSAGKTYKVPQIYKRYRIVQEDNSRLQEEMMVSYDNQLNFDYFKNHIPEYLKYKPYIEKLSDFIKKSKQNTLCEMSINERSFDIFGDEKFLSSNDGQMLLNKLKISETELLIYRTPEPFFYYVSEQSTSNNVLIVENKDTWYSMRRLMMNRDKILGLEFKCIIYGEGRKIQSSFMDIAMEEYNSFNSKENLFFYFGDIDSYGISILKSLQEQNPEYKIIPFYEGYKFLLTNYQRKRFKSDKLNKLTDNTISMFNIYNIFKKLSETEQELIYKICIENYILPQEIVNNEVLHRKEYIC